MGIHYENLDETTRGYMHKEFELGGLYESPRLTEEGKEVWPSLLEEAIKSHDDDWLAQELLRGGYIKSRESVHGKRSTWTKSINKPHAAQQLAEGEFNRYYIRGLCLRAKDEGKNSLIVYRGKAVSHPRAESESKIGTEISVDALLEELRKHDFVSIEGSKGVPGGPSSGITCKLS